MSNFTIAAPLLALAAGALVILLLDLILPAERGHSAWYVAALGSIAVAGYYLVPLWGSTSVGFNGAMVMDPFALSFSLILLVAGLLTVLLSFTRTEKDKSGYLALVLWAVMGMLTMASAGNLMTIFLGLELLSLALYVAVAFDSRHPNAREAAIKYFFLGSAASAFILFGFALVYGVTGTMDLNGIAAAASGSDLYYKVGVGLALVGIAFKLALVPFHTWAPDVYQGAPTAVTAFMSVGTKAAAFAVMARFLVAAVPADRMSAYLLPVGVLAALSMILGSTVGIWQNDLKRLMAYSGIANAGYLIMALPGLTTNGLSAGAYFMAAYTFTAMGIFAIIALLEHEGLEGSDLFNLTGLYYRRPGLAAAMALLMFANAGLPPTGGFVGKFLLAIAAVNGGAWLLLGALIISTGIAAYVYLRVIGTMFRNPDGLSARERKLLAGGEEELSLTSNAIRNAIYAVLIISIVGTLWLGILPGTVMPFFQVGF